MSVAEVPHASPPPASTLHVSGKGSAARGRGCKIGRGLPLQQRKVYRNLARQTPRVQGLTFDHNQIRWISYWKNEQNKQVQKHFPVSRYGFLGARRLALEERNRIMGRPPDADEAAEAIANLKIDPSIPCFLEWNSPSQHEEVQAVEMEDDSTAEAWQDEDGDSLAEAHRSETTKLTGSTDNLVTTAPMLSPELLPGQLPVMDIESAPHGSAVNPAIGDCQPASKRQSTGSFDSSDFLQPNFQPVGCYKRQDHPTSLRAGEISYTVSTTPDVFPPSSKTENANDEFLSRTITRNTTAALDSCADRQFTATDRTTSSTSACFEEPELPPDGGVASIIPQDEPKEVSTDGQRAEAFKRPMPPALSPVAIAWEEKFMSCEHTIDTGPMGLFCTTDGERRSCALSSAFAHGPKRIGSNNDFDTAGHSLSDAFKNAGYFSPRSTSSDAGSPTQGLSKASTMREVFNFCDSRKHLCASLVHDLFQGMRTSGTHSPKGSLFPGGGTMPADLRCRDFLEREEAMHSLVIEEAKGLDQLEPYLEIFRQCLVAGLMPSQLPLGEMVSMVWTLRCRMLVPWGRSSAIRHTEQQFGVPIQSLSPFRERHGMTHRLLTGVNVSAHLTPDLNGTSTIGLGSPTAAVGRTSAFIPPPSLFFGPAHAPSSPTAALYGGRFASATVQDHYSTAP